MHVLWPLIPRSAWQPQQFQCLSSLRHRQSMPFLSIAEHSLAVAKQIISAALQTRASRSRSIARLLDAHRCNSSAIPCHAHPKRVSASARISFQRLVSAVPRLSFSKRFPSASPQGLRRTYPCCSFLLRVIAPRCLCSASPFNAFAYARQCISVACRINALASLCTCLAPRFSAPSHVLWPLSPRSAGHIPAIPQHVLASHRQRLSSLRHRQSMPFFSVAISRFVEPFHRRAQPCRC